MFSLKNHIVTVACCTAVLCLRSVAAQEVSAAAKLEKLNEEIAVLTAQKQKLNLEAEVNAKQLELGRSRNSSSLDSEQGAVPVVRSIEGIDGKLYATLSFGNGMQQTVKQGEKIHGGWIVTQIDVKSVLLTKGSDRVRLAFGKDPSPYQTNGQPTAIGASIPNQPFPR